MSVEPISLCLLLSVGCLSCLCLWFGWDFYSNVYSVPYVEHFVQVVFLYCWGFSSAESRLHVSAPHSHHRGNFIKMKILHSPIDSPPDIMSVDWRLAGGYFLLLPNRRTIYFAGRRQKILKQHYIMMLCQITKSLFNKFKMI